MRTFAVVLAIVSLAACGISEDRAPRRVDVGTSEASGTDLDRLDEAGILGP